ncbi:MAG: diacylglycerol/lipid kinase family protein [Actinomycetota bacterium]
MTSPYGEAVVIVNPLSAHRQFGRDLRLLDELLATTGIEYRVETSSKAGESIDLAARAAAAGARYLIAVGGDGTINEVVNGILMAHTGGETVLGVIPAGSGSDYIRTFGLPPKAEDAARHLSGEEYFAVDAGRVTFQAGGEQRSRWFANIAEAGIGAEVARLAGRLPRSLKRWRYLLGFWGALAGFRLTTGKVSLDKRIYEGRVTDLVVANAQFYGGGMRVAPRAHPADGKFDVLVMRGNRRDYIEALTKVYKGNHVPAAAIREYTSLKVAIETERPLTIETDGEVVGKTPATFEIVPNAFRLKI